ncbi:MAG: hypothetical protein Alpg2KO_14890 [Alphaproteobacteria bacterium]
MSDEKPIIGDVAGLSKPAEVLIENISGAIGRIYKPTHIKRIADARAKATIIQAEADAEAGLILAQGEIEQQELRERAAKRLIEDEIKNQENIEKIAFSAASKIQSTDNISSLDDDWIRFFFNHAKATSNEKAQDMWASILAREAIEPETFPKRAIIAMSTMEHSDARLFEKLCSSIYTINHAKHCLVKNIKNAPKDNELSYDELRHLSTLGLIDLSSIGTFTAHFKRPQTNETIFFVAKYQDWTGYYTVDDKISDLHIDVGYILLTNMGKSFSTIANPNFDGAFLDTLKEHLESQGLTLQNEETETQR